MAVTGQDGAETISWALQALTLIEEQLEGQEYPIILLVSGSDDRRWKLYERVLTRRGYKATMVDNERTLVKGFNR